MLFKNIGVDDINIIADYIFPYLEKQIPLLINGELGTGKTTLVRMIGKTFNIKDNIKSPSFNKMNIYDDKMVHIDGYNINGNLDAYEDFFDNKIIIIEWANNVSHNFKEYLLLNIKINDENDNSRDYLFEEINENNFRYSK